MTTTLPELRFDSKPENIAVVEKLIDHTETRSVRVAIIIWAAIVTCLNHWPASKAFHYQKWAVSILDRAIAGVSEELKGFWERTIENFTSSR